MKASDSALFSQLTLLALEYAGRGEVPPPEEAAVFLMELPGLPTHCPEHHFIVPAALLISFCLSRGDSRDRLAEKLEMARGRAAAVPGGFCGNCGCCGAAVGAGIAASLLLDTAPKQERNWDFVNHVTAACLTKIAGIGGPRCCKRVTFLALAAARPLLEQKLGLQLPAGTKPLCRYFPVNPECKHGLCPFYPR